MFIFEVVNFISPSIKYRINLIFPVVVCICKIHVFNRVIPCQIIQNFWIMSPLSHGFFFEIFTSGRCHRKMKTLKILASNSKHFRIYGTFNKWQIGVPRLTFQILLFLRSVLLQTASGRENSPGYVFWLKKSKSDIKFALKDTACPKM